MTVPSDGNAHGILLMKKKGERSKRVDTKTRLRHDSSRNTLPIPEHTAWQDAAQELASQVCGVPIRGNSAPVAQSDRALASGAKGRAFESRRAHQNGIKDLDVKIWVLFSWLKSVSNAILTNRRKAMAFNKFFCHLRFTRICMPTYFLLNECQKLSFSKARTQGIQRVPRCPAYLYFTFLRTRCSRVRLSYLRSHGIPRVDDDRLGSFRTSRNVSKVALGHVMGSDKFSPAGARPSRKHVARARLQPQQPC